MLDQGRQRRVSRQQAAVDNGARQAAAAAAAALVEPAAGATSAACATSAASAAASADPVTSATTPIDCFYGKVPVKRNLSVEGKGTTSASARATLSAGHWSQRWHGLGTHLLLMWERGLKGKGCTIRVMELVCRGGGDNPWKCWCYH